MKHVIVGIVLLPVLIACGGTLAILLPLCLVLKFLNKIGDDAVKEWR